MLVLLVGLAATVLGRLVYRGQHARNRLAREAALRDGRYGRLGVPLASVLSTEVAANAASTVFSLLVAALPALALGGLLAGIVAVTGGLPSPARLLLFVLPYPVIAGVIWPWRKRRVFRRRMATLTGGRFHGAA